MIGLYYREG
jgi:hypothetical protein